MRFILQNHQETACLRDTLRLFFSHLEQSEDGFTGQVYQLAPKYQGQNVCIHSQLSRPLTLAVLRGREEAAPVQVTTSIVLWTETTELNPVGDKLAKRAMSSHERESVQTASLSQPGCVSTSNHSLPNLDPFTRLWQMSCEVSSLDVRRELKRQAYFALSELTGLTWPWGSLTGVRPSQVAAQILADLEGEARPTQIDLFQDPEPAGQVLVEHFALSPAKAAKLLAVTLAEMDLLEKLPAEDYLVYLGVPFCPGRCAYCSFIAQDASRFAGDLTSYAQALAQEIKAIGLGLAGQGQISALYMGGGTPTSLTASDLDLVLSSARQYLPLRPEAEITVEAGRADTINKAKLQVMREHGVKRICLNPQTMHDKTLARIGRKHTVAQVYEAFDLARQLGFDDINMDLILGLPGEGPEDLADSLNQVLDLGADSITIHSLAFKRSAYLFEQLQSLSKAELTPVSDQREISSEVLPRVGKNSPTAPGEEGNSLTTLRGRKNSLTALREGESSLSALDLQAQLFLPDPKWTEALDLAEMKLGEAGYKPYYLYRQKQVISGLENTGFARPGKACVYNVGMMSDQRQVIGLGAGSASKRLRGGQLERLYNTKDLGEYMSDLETIVRKKLQFFLT